MIFKPEYELRNLSGIYIIRNVIDSRVYIGECNNFYKRFGRHKSCLNLNKHCNKKLLSFVNKYGIDKLEFDILEIATNNLIDLEIEYILKHDSINSGFNIILDSRTMQHMSKELRVNGRTSHKGYKLSEKSRKAISEGHKEYYKRNPGTTRAKWSEERKLARRKYIAEHPEIYTNRRKSSGNKTNHKCGSLMSNTNLTEQLVYNIKLDIKNNIKKSEILKRYPISESLYRSIKGNKTWKHVMIN